METKQIFQESQKNINWQITIKVFIIGAIAIALLIPKFMILGLISERTQTAESARKEIMGKWSLEQIIRGPVLSIPYLSHSFDMNNKKIEEIKECYFLPETLKIDGEIKPQKLKRSIYQAVVYESVIKIGGSFNTVDFETLKINPEDILWEKAKILVAINDLRGINNQVSFKWKERNYTFSPGMENNLIGTNGISLPLSDLSAMDFPSEFQFELNLKGSESLQFAPLGKTTEVNLHSTWNDPGFTGNFLPADRNISNEGFTASWKILNFNRNYPQEWKDNEYHVTQSDFGVQLVTMADHYQKNSRTAKYGILVILFVFLSFFLNEIITKQKIHPFQYILVGFAILIFYLLLLSISEQLGFNYAYLISAVAVILMVLAYSKTFLDKWGNSILLTLILTFAFGFIFVLMQLESLALLVGSIGLFFVLALTMFFTRKINWYNEKTDY
ncbi:MAG: cell envelope integrity protein CreD [Prolixibacteraceae bacterium]|nr:cell envelope integrity protein CreD [Prolixibacteraceae bacterium]MBN2773525.1 cell envelope integrity protein CreD [Prolixibacteraceae bacterium]